MDGRRNVQPSGAGVEAIRKTDTNNRDTCKSAETCATEEITGAEEITDAEEMVDAEKTTAGDRVKSLLTRKCPDCVARSEGPVSVRQEATDWSD
jgi:hypothetical protein